MFYLPAAYKNKWNMTSGLVVQSAHDTTAATANLYFYDRSSDPLPDGWQGSIVLRANGPLVAVMRVDGSVATNAYGGRVR